MSRTETGAVFLSILVINWAGVLRFMSVIVGLRSQLG